MPKLFVCCLLFIHLLLLPFKQLLGQTLSVTKTDSLIHQLPFVKDDTNRVNLLNEICESYTSVRDSQKLMLYAVEGLKLAQKSGWIKGQLRALKTLGTAYGVNGDFQKMFAYVREAYELAKRNQLTDQQYDLQMELVGFYEMNKKYEEALSNAKAVLDYYLQFHPKSIDTSSWFVCNKWWNPAFEIGQINYYLNKNTATLNLYQQILHRFTRENDSLGIRTALNLLMRYSNDYVSNYDETRKYCFEELKYFRRGDTSAAHASVITYIANAYRWQKDYVKALEYYRMALALKPDARIEIKNSANSGMRLIYSFLGDYSRALDLDLQRLSNVALMEYSEYSKLQIYDDISDDYTGLKQYNLSLQYLNKGLELNRRMSGGEANPRSLLAVANIYYLTHRYDEAILKFRESVKSRWFDKNVLTMNLSLLYWGKIIRDAPDNVLRKQGILPITKYQQSLISLNKALVYFTNNYPTYYLKDCYKELSATYDSMRDYRNFHSTYKKYIALRDSSVNRENQNAFISKLADIQFEKKEDSLNYQQRLTSDKLRQQTLVAAQQRKYYTSGIVALLILSFFIGRTYYNQRKSNKVISAEKQRSDNLLLNILPADVAEELKEKGSAGARLYEEVTVLFTDFVNFTTISELLTPQELVDELHTCFKGFDDIITKYGIEKIKTIGDAYLAVAGLPNADAQHAGHTVRAALEIRQFIHDRKEQMGNRSFDIRIGIHSGSVVAGIVGVKKFAYDIWGDTVNTAARMEQHSLPGQINLSEKTYDMVRDQFAFTYRGEIEAKNKGPLKMYFVEKQLTAMAPLPI